MDRCEAGAETGQSGRRTTTAQEEGLAVLGCVGILHDAFGLKLVSDLPEAYRQLLASGAYVDHVLLENIVKILNLPPL